MECLSTLDAGFLEAEDADQHVSLAVGALAILSDADDLVFGITADYDAASDVDELATGIERAAACLTKWASNDARLVSDG
jgi:hypothetical protein